MPEILRRDFLEGLLTGLALTLAGVGCKESQEAEATRKRVAGATNEVLKNDPEEVELMVDESIPIPGFQILKNRTLKIPLPEGLEMSEAELEALAQDLKEQFLKGVEKSRVLFEKNSRSFLRFLGTFLQYIEEVSPKAAGQLSNFRKSLEKKTQEGEILEAIIKTVNNYISRAGLYVFVHGNDDKELSVSLYNLGKESGYIEVANDGKQYQVPFLTLDKALLHSGQEFEFDGVYDFYPEIILVSTNTEDCLIHEATHFLLHKIFPETTALTAETRIATDVRYKASGKIRGYVEKPYHPIAYDELGGTGMELANSKSKENLLLNLKSENPNNELAVFYIALGVIKTMRNIEKRKQLLDHLDQKGTFNLHTIAEAVKDPEFTMGDVRSVGIMMYRVAYDFLRKAESGAANRVQ